MVEAENPLARATRSERIVRQLGDLRGARVLDIGCGPGRVTIPLAQAVGASGTVFALDCQRAMLNRVAHKFTKGGLTNVRLIESTLRGDVIDEASLDTAVAVMVLGEIPNPATVFPLVFAALKPGGRLLVAETIFDPHYLRLGWVRENAAAAGFAERDLAGNVFGYASLFQKPAPLPPSESAFANAALREDVRSVTTPLHT